MIPKSGNRFSDKPCSCSRLKENGIEVEFREQSIWLPPSVKVSVDFWADEAVEAYWLDNVAPCSCRD